MRLHCHFASLSSDRYIDNNFGCALVKKVIIVFTIYHHKDTTNKHVYQAD